TADGGSLTALWRPSGNWSLRLNAFYQAVKGSGTNDITFNDPRTLQALGDLPQSKTSGAGPYNRKTAGVSGVLKGKFGGIDFTSLTGGNINTASDYAYDGTPALGALTQHYFGVGGAPIYTYDRGKNLSEELRLSGAFGQKLDWLLAGYYAHR